jgi:hypothetical protein
MTHQQSSELAKLGVGWFDDPTPLVAPQFTPIFVPPMPIVREFAASVWERGKVGGRRSM